MKSSSSAKTLNYYLNQGYDPVSTKSTDTARNLYKKPTLNIADQLASANRMSKPLKSGFHTEKNHTSKSKDFSPLLDANHKSSTLRKKDHFNTLVITKAKSSALYKKTLDASTESVLAFDNPFIRDESRTFEIPFQDDPKIADHKALIERSQQLAMKRKRKSEKSPLRLAPLQNREVPNQQQMGRTLMRFIDRMILKGSLPMEATEFFIPEPKKVNIKSQGKLKPIHRKEDGRTSIMPTEVSESGIGSGKVLVKDLIPSWMTGLEEFNERYKTTQQTSKIPVIDILKKPWEDRDDIEENFLLKWLSKIDLFTKHSYDILINLSKRLKCKTVEEGKVLCNVGEPADCMYIIYEGEIEVLIPQKTGDLLAVKSSTGEILGRQCLDKPGKRAAKLRASKFSHIIMLFRNDFQEVTGNKASVNKPAQHILEFITNHNFLRQFTEAKKLALANEMEYRTYYKNDLIYNIGERSEKIYLLMEGIVTREMPITREKINKWPTSMDRWEMYKKVSKYAVKLPIEIGEIFGIDDMVSEKARSEKVLVEGDAVVLACPRQLFYEIFENYEVFNFVKLAEEIEKTKSHKITELFDIQEKLHKIKTEAKTNQANVLAAHKNPKNVSQIERIKQWIRAEEKLSSPTYTEKKLLEQNEVRKDLKSVYES